MRTVRKSLAIRRALIGAASAGVAWGLAVPATAQVAAGSSVNPRVQWSDPPERFASRVVATGLEDPWEVTYGPDGFLWITERVGKRVVRVDPINGGRRVAARIDEVYQTLPQDGLLGLALHPQLLRGSDYVYVMYTYDGDAGPAEERRAKIRRYTFDAASEQLRDPVDLLTALPHGPDHGASRLVFGPDGKLYASRGDHGSNFLAFYCAGPDDGTIAGIGHPDDQAFRESAADRAGLIVPVHRGDMGRLSLLGEYHAVAAARERGRGQEQGQEGRAPGE
jgi:glucose/arabinose dehydrogenase